MLLVGLTAKHNVFQVFFLNYEMQQGSASDIMGPISEATFLQNTNLSAGVPLKAEPVTKACVGSLFGK